MVRDLSFLNMKSGKAAVCVFHALTIGEWINEVDMKYKPMYRQSAVASQLLGPFCFLSLGLSMVCLTSVAFNFAQP